MFIKRKNLTSHSRSLYTLSHQRVSKGMTDVLDLVSFFFSFCLFVCLLVVVGGCVFFFFLFFFNWVNASYNSVKLYPNQALQTQSKRKKNML